MDSKLVIALGMAIATGATGDVLLSLGMKARGEVAIGRLSDVPPVIKMIFTSPCVLMGILSMAVYYGSYITALSWIDVSVANPLTALSYVIATAFAVLIMREHVNIKRWIGVSLITLGAILVGISS